MTRSLLDRESFLLALVWLEGAQCPISCGLSILAQKMQIIDKP